MKWGKESYDVEVDTSLPGVVFKTQLYTLTGVPPDRQKIMGCKNAPLKVRKAQSRRRAAPHPLTRARARRTTPTWLPRG